MFSYFSIRHEKKLPNQTMIKPISYRKLNLAEKQTFIDEVLNAFDKHPVEQPTIQLYIEEVRHDYDLLRASAAHISHTDLTQTINEGDAIRDDGLVSLKMVAERSTKRRDSEWVKAGQLILQVFHDYGNRMAELSLQKETATVDLLLSEAESNEELKKAIATIKAEDWLQDIKDGQQIVKEYITKRDKAKGNDSLPSSFEVAKSLGNKIEKLFKFINLKMEFEQDSALEPLVDNLNNIIKRHRDAVKRREALKKKTKKTGE